MGVGFQDVKHLTCDYAPQTQSVVVTAGDEHIAGSVEERVMNLIEMPA